MASSSNLSGAHTLRQGSQVESQAGMSLLRRSSQHMTSGESRSVLDAKISKNYDPFVSSQSTPSEAATVAAATGMQQRDQISLITSAPRSKKVYIYTGSDEFKQTIYPISEIGTSKPKANIEDARLSPKLVRPTNRGILKRKGQDSANGPEDLSAFQSIDDNANGEKEVNKRIEPKGSQSGGTTGGISLGGGIGNGYIGGGSAIITPSAQPAISMNSNKQLNNSTILIKPNSKKNSDLPVTDNLFQNAPNNNIGSYSAPQSIVPVQEGVDHKQSADKSTLSGKARHTVLMPLEEDPSGEVKGDSIPLNSHVWTQTESNKHANFDIDSSSRSSGTSRIPFRKTGMGTTTDRTPNRGQRSLFYQMDDYTNVDIMQTSVSPITTPMAGVSESESNKFVHTQSYLKRRIDNMERSKLNGSMPMLNEIISLPRQSNTATSLLKPQQPDGFSEQLAQKQSQKQSKNSKQFGGSRYISQPFSIGGGGGGASKRSPQGQFSDDEQQHFTDTEQQNQQHLNAMKLLRSKRRTASQTLSPFRYEGAGVAASNKVSIDVSDLHGRESNSVRNSPVLQNRQIQSRTPNSRYPQHAPNLMMNGLDASNPLLRDYYQLRMNNVPLSNDRVITDPLVYTHQAYQRSNMQRQQNQNRMINLLEEQDKIMGKIIEKYKIRANKEEVNLKQKLSQLEKERDQLFRLKTHEQTLGKIKASLITKLDSFKSDAHFYNEQLSPQMPSLPQQRFQVNQPDLHDLVFLDSIIASQSNAPVKNRYFNQMNSNLIRQKRSRSQLN